MVVRRTEGLLVALMWLSMVVGVLSVLGHYAGLWNMSAEAVAAVGITSVFETLPP